MITKRPEPIPPEAGQESVWDYPRPPRLERTEKRLHIIFASEIIADTVQGWRVLETSHPPVYYFPPEDVEMKYLRESTQSTFCEFKGRGSYFHVQSGKRKAVNAAWYYPDPRKRFLEIKDYIAFYPLLMDACYVDDQLVSPQPGGFYGGWITEDIVGAFKGEPGSWGV